MKILTILLITTLSLPSAAQEIAGTVLDKKKEPLFSASVLITQGGIIKATATTDIDGKYASIPLKPRYYDVLVTHAGYDSMMVTGVVVETVQRTTVNFEMQSHNLKRPQSIILKGYKKPLIGCGVPASTTIMQKENPPRLPIVNLSNMKVRDTMKLTPVPIPTEVR